jgi:hypothetical protein
MTGWRQFHPVAPEDSRENRPLGSVTLARLRDLRDRLLSVNRSRIKKIALVDRQN